MEDGREKMEEGRWKVGDVSMDVRQKVGNGTQKMRDALAFVSARALVFVLAVAVTLTAAAVALQCAGACTGACWCWCWC